MMLLMGIITLFSGTIDLLTSRSANWLYVYYQSFMYTLMCSVFCAALLVGFYSRLECRHRIVEFVIFFGLVFLGVFLGVNTAFLTLNGRFPVVSLQTMTIPLFFGLVASGIMTLITVLNMRVEEKVARLRDAATENERLKRLESEARMASLQAKLNPHFLFNTLNSLAALVYEDPVKAENGIVRLSEVYRSVLAISSQQRITAAEEIRLITDYLSLEQLRFDSQLSFSINCPQRLLGKSIPGLLLEPLVSNVIKHVLEKTDQPVHINVDIEEKDGRLFLTVADNGPGFNENNIIQGYGHISIEERLSLLYGSEAKFIFQSLSSGARASISLPVIGEAAE